MTTHTSDESNNSMHAPDVHTERGFDKEGEENFPVSAPQPPLALVCF